MLFFDQRLIDGLSVAIYTCDAQGRIVLFNKAAVELWGRTPQAGVDKWCGSWRLFHPNGTPLSFEECPMAIALKEGRSVLGDEIILERPDGTRRRVQAHPSPIFDSTGKLIGAVNLFIERTGAIAPANPPSPESPRTRDDFFAVLSHELRTPLTPALLSLEGMEVDPMLPESLRRNIAMVRRNVELEARIIDDLLDLGRLSRGELKLFIEPVSLNDGLRDVCGICRPQVLERKLRLELRLDAAAGLVMADSARLQQVMWNLLKNAIKFTPAQGSVSARTFRTQPGVSAFEISYSSALAFESSQHMFDPFVAGAPAEQHPFSDRLGLAVAKSLIEQQHGTLAVEGVGTAGVKFTVELPALPSRLATADNAAGSKIAPRNRLLLVEDHGDTALALERYLALSGFIVHSVPGLPEALQLFEHESFDLVISDIGLGQMSGCDLIREIHHRWNVPGIAISGYGSDRDIRRSFDAGFSEHLVKPLKLNQLIETVTRVLDQSHRPNTMIAHGPDPDPAGPLVVTGNPK